MLTALIITAALAMVYANGANANFKGVASLFGSSTTSYWTAVRWAAVTTAAGCLAALFMPGTLMQTFSGKGLVPDHLVGQPDFLLAVGMGAAIANLLATRLGFPVSTTHMLMGALLGAGLAAEPEGVRYTKLWESFARPLLITPALALVLGGTVYLLLKLLRLAPDHRTPLLDALHFLSAGAVGFARGMNDSPKLLALLVGGGQISEGPGLLLVMLFMALGGFISARQVADTLSHKITGMNPGQGFAANLATSLLTTTASFHGLPVSTTHVSVGALLGIGITTKQARWRTVVPVLMAWLITLPCAGLLAAFMWWLVTLRGE